MKTFGTPEQVISYFDFTVARAALLPNDTALVDERFEDDIKNKILHIEHIVCPLMSVRRIAKYVLKGYFISTKEVLKLFLAYQQRDMTRVAYLLQQDTLTPDEVLELQTGLYVD